MLLRVAGSLDCHSCPVPARSVSKGGNGGGNSAAAAALVRAEDGKRLAGLCPSQVPTTKL